MMQEKIELEFTQRPVDVPPDLRLYRRLAMLCISVAQCSHGKSASFNQLHFINSLMMDEEFRALYVEFKSARTSSLFLSPSMDPYLNRCVNYAIGANLLFQKEVKSGFRVSLGDKGIEFVGGLKAQNLASDIFVIASEIGRVSENEVKAAMKEGF